MEQSDKDFQGKVGSFGWGDVVVMEKKVWLRIIRIVNQLPDFGVIAHDVIKKAWHRK